MITEYFYVSNSMKTQRLAVLSEDYFMTEPIMTYIWTFILAVIPISEIRGSIIYGLSQVDHNFLNILFIYVLSVIANFLPVPFILLAFRPIIKWLKKTKLLGKFATWLEARTHRKAGDISRKSSKAAAVAIYIFVSIPFPTTGAWTGSMIAGLLDMRAKYALPAVLLGIMTSGAIMTLLVTGALNLGSFGEWLTH